MRNGESKYDKVIGILKNSVPEPVSKEILTEKIMGKLITEKRNKFPDVLFELLFGWIYIGWFRRSLAGAAFLILIFFGFQQIIIIRRINDLSGKMITTDNRFNPAERYGFSGKLALYRISTRKIRPEDLVANEKEIDRMIESFKELQVKYKDIFDLVEKDPQLKKYLMEKLTENQKLKPNI